LENEILEKRCTIPCHSKTGDELGKLGVSIDILRRTNEHNATYGSIPGVNLRLRIFNFIDPQYIFPAEGDIKSITAGNIYCESIKLNIQKLTLGIEPYVALCSFVLLRMSIETPNLRLRIFNFIDPQYIFPAEGDLKLIIAGLGLKFVHNNDKELIILPKDKFKLIRNQYDLIGNKYLGHVTELVTRIKDLEHKLDIKMWPKRKIPFH
jgi:hypothetical protein